MTYDKWERQEGLSPNSPEAAYAEAAWNAALQAARRVVLAAATVETTPARLAVLLDAELEGMSTGFGTSLK